MSDTPDVLDAQWLPADLLWIAPHLRRLSGLGYVVVKAPGLSHGDELEPVGFNGHLRVVPRTPAADEACEHCDDGIVWVGSCCAVCGGIGVVLSPENGEC